jgi:hypothetical protein
MTQLSVTIQIAPESVPSTPSWLGEVAALAQVLAHVGLVKAIQDHVQFARARFGQYDTIDFVVVLIGYALSGEPTLKAFYERLSPFAGAFMALFGRDRLPDRSTLSRFLAALDQESVEALRTLFQKDLVSRTPFATPGGLWDRLGNHWLVVDVDATKQAARQRALPQQASLPVPHRRMTQVAASGYRGRKRGEVVRTRTTILQAATHQWIGTYSGPGNGDYRGELKRSLEAITTYATALSLPVSQVLIRLDGLYGNAAPLSDVLISGLAVIARGKDYSLLDLPEVKERLAHGPDQESTHPESGAFRALYDCPEVPLTSTGPRVRLIVASHPASSTPPSIGVQREGMVYELFVTMLPQTAFSPKDVLDLYLHRGSFETVLADEDVEQDPDRWCSRTPCGQEFWQIMSQWMWNLRLELGQHLSPTAVRLTEFAPALPQAEPAPEASPALASEPALVKYGPPQWARPSFTGGFPGSAFTPQPDGTLRCPADHPLYPQERRPERDGSYRLLYAARIGDCRGCELRAQCQESLSTSKPRRVSAVFWPLSLHEEVPSAPVLEPPPSLPKPLEALPRSPVLWGDWPRCQIRRNWLKVVRSETVVVAMGATPTGEPVGGVKTVVLTRAQRAHWRLSWHERFVRNARPSSAPQLTLTLHGLPATFAKAYGFGLLAAA